MLYDAQQRTQAEHVATLGLDLARKAGYVESAAHAFENLCTFNAQHDPLRAAAYAQHGLQLRGLADEDRVRLRVRLATALTASSANPKRQARQALDQARTMLDDLSPISAAMVLGNAGIALGRLKLHEEADQSLAQAVRLFGHMPQLSALYLAQQIKAALHANDPDKAAHQIHALTRLTPLVESARLDQHITDILKSSTPWANSRDMRNAREHLHTVASGTLPP
ncbi:hypothetical protein DPM19_08925 [Actinomadura craniellae]|uniref:MalT-like TPR region domain-containing protein n=1 Tax=Actinomadura craniellae TaxID=2231787 RepID=A0A365H9W2_9ACTN|nr:hypothetical protein DPM19_08925 [Actinomadura craniellae]